MKKYYFEYHEYVTNYKSIEIYLDEDTNPQAIADTLMSIDEFINWDEQGIINDESEIRFREIPANEDHEI